MLGPIARLRLGPAAPVPRAPMTAARSITALSIVALSIAAPSVALLAPAPAAAHGRPLYVERARFDPGDADRIVLQASFGLVESRDAGESWRWLCAAAYRADPTSEDPDVVVREGGRVVIGDFDGAAASDASLCDWRFPDGVARDIEIRDLEADPFDEAVVWGVATSGAEADAIVRSDDAGRSWAAVGAPIADVLVERVARSAADPMRLYASGADPSVPGARRALVFRSSDAGATLTPTEIPLLDGERFPHLVAVDPTNADRVFVVMTRRVTDTRPWRLMYSDDGAASFRLAFELDDLSAVAVSGDGRTVWVGSSDGAGVHVARDGSLDFAPVVDLAVRCLEARGDELWLCVDPHREGFALGRSTDGGETVEPVLRLGDVETQIECGRCSTAGIVCPAWQTDLDRDLATLRDAAPTDDAGLTGLPRDAAIPLECLVDGGSMDAGPGPGAPGDCGCRAAGVPAHRDAPGLLLALGLLVATRRARRRARSAPPDCQTARARRTLAACDPP